MNKKYEQMATFNMSMVRYYANKCGTIGLFDKFDGKICKCCGIENALYCYLGYEYDGQL